MSFQDVKIGTADRRGHHSDNGICWLLCNRIRYVVPTEVLDRVFTSLLNEAGQLESASEYAVGSTPFVGPNPSAWLLRTASNASRPDRPDEMITVYQCELTLERKLCRGGIRTVRMTPNSASRDEASCHFEVFEQGRDLNESRYSWAATQMMLHNRYRLHNQVLFVR
jgi:hypothetical protein